MLDLGFLSFLAEPWFVIPWYAVGALGAVWALVDMLTLNKPVNAPLKAAWPIIIVFLSVIGLLLYVTTSRPPGIGKKEGAEEEAQFEVYAANKFRKTTGSAIHCVAGDGLGIMTAMVVARIVQVAFWTEFWFEYAVGYVFGWFIFQTWAMKMHGNGWLAAWLKGGRAEFFSMITVMAGMGVVMGWVTPHVVGAQPHPTTFAFWGFATLGLLVGLIATYPMNLWLLKMGWKHGMG